MVTTVMVMAAAVAVVVMEVAVVVGEAAAAVAAAVVVTAAVVVVAVMEERAGTVLENEVVELVVSFLAVAVAVSKGQLGPLGCPGSRSTLYIRMPRPPRMTLLECQCRRRGGDPWTRG